MMSRRMSQGRELTAMRRIAIIAGALASLSLAGGPVLAQTAGKGGTGVDENTELPRCAQPLGVVALVEEKAPSPTDGLAGELLEPAEHAAPRDERDLRAEIRVRGRDLDSDDAASAAER